MEFVGCGGDWHIAEVEDFAVTAAITTAINTFESQYPLSTTNRYIQSISNTTSLDNLRLDKWYIMCNNGRNNYVSLEGESGVVKVRAKNNIAVDNSASQKASYLFKFERHGDNYYIRNANGKYFSLSQNGSAISANPVEYEIKNIGSTSDHFYIRQVSDGRIADGQESGNNFVGWNTTIPTATGGNNDYTFCCVELYNNTVVYVYNGNEIHRDEMVTTTIPDVGSMVTINDTEYVVKTSTNRLQYGVKTYTLTLATTKVIYSHDDEVVQTVENTATPANTLTVDDVFYVVTGKTSAMVDDVYIVTAMVKTLPEVLPTGYYTMGSVDTGRARFVYNDYLYESNTNHYTLQSTATTRPKNAVWHITTNDNTSTIQIKNQDGHGLKNDRSEYAELTVGRYFGDNTSFYFTQAINASHSNNFNLSSGESYLTNWEAGGETPNDNRWVFAAVDDANVLNVAITGVDGAYVSYGNDVAFNGGFLVSTEPITSTEGLTPVSMPGYRADMAISDGVLTVSYVYAVPELQAELQALLDAVMPVSVGYYTQASVDAYNEVRESVRSVATSDDITELVNAIATINDAHSLLVRQLPATNAFYRLKGIYSGGYIQAPTVTDASGRFPVTVFENEEDVLADKESIWYLNDDNQLISYNIGLGFCETHSPARVGDTPHTWTFETNTAVAVPYLVLKSNYNGSQYLVDWTDNKTNRMGFNATYTAWWVQEVTVLPVTLNSRGFATVNLPVTVTLDADSEATMWYAGIDDVNTNDNIVVMTKLVGDVLPANTPVILHGEANATILFNIEGAEDAIESNALKGTLSTITNAAVRTQFGCDKTLVMSVYNSVPGLYNYEGNIQAFKAFLPYNMPVGVQQVAPMRIQWGDLETAIEAADGGLADGVMYNLNGQRVMRSKGAVIVDGRVIYVK